MKKWRGLTDRLARHPLVSFYCLAFAISWTGYLPLLAGQRGVAFFVSPLWLVFLVLPALGPALAAWAVSSAGRENGSGPSRLRASLLVRAGWAWWMVALLGPAVLHLVANQVSLWWKPAQAPMDAPLRMSSLLLFSLMSIAANPWEEVGWRGFAQPRLQARFGASVAALIVGVLWALWHLPLFMLPGTPVSMGHLPFFAWALGTVAHAFLLAWLFNVSKRSLAVVMVFHIANNIWAAALGMRSQAVTSCVSVLVVALVLAVWGWNLGMAEPDSTAHTRAA